MCVGFWSLENPDYALILCSNRDEYLSRPTAPAHFHSFEKLGQPENVGVGTVLSGRDLRAGGSWLGLNRTGRVAVLTNITEEAGQYNSTRGELVSSFLLPDPPNLTFQQHTDHLISKNISYAGFNELLLSPTFTADSEGVTRVCYDAAFVTNSGGGGRISVRRVTGAERQCGGISNGVDGHGADSWPKVKQGTKLLSDVLKLIGPQTSDAELSEHLFSILAWQGDIHPHDRSELKNTIHIEPLHLPISQPPDSTPDLYGTRLSTVILVHRDGRAQFIERDIWLLEGENKLTKAEAKSQRVYDMHFIG